MKARAISLFITAVISASIFTSCLDNDDNNIECPNDIAYITYHDSVKCAATSCGYVTSPEIKNLKLDECYILGYEITKPSINNIYTAERVYNISEKPLKQTCIQTGAPSARDSFAVSDLKVPFFSPTEYLGDRCMFTYSIPYSNNLSLTPHIYFDPNNQIDKDGNNIKGKNKIIVDIYFSKNDSTSGNNNYRQSFIGNMKDLRNFIFTSEYSNEISTYENGGRYIAVMVQFRYHKFVYPNKSVISYIGNWDKNSYAGTYYMIAILYTNN